MLQVMARTRPWVLLLAVLGFVMSGLGVGIAIWVMIAAGPAWGAIAFVVGLLIVAVVGVYGFCAYLLLAYCNKIQLFLRRKGPEQFDDAVVTQQKVWKFTGIMTLVALGLMILAVVSGLMAGGVTFGTTAPASPAPAAPQTDTDPFR
jgi:hypothetical protein